MIKYEVLLSETVRKQLKDLPIDLQQRIKASLMELKNDPFRSRPKVDIKRLKGPNRNYFRLRIGDYRVLYVIEETNVMVAKVFHRSQGYDWIE